MRKGQSAMEYLMTYGWAILIVIIAGGVIWYYASQATTSATAVKGGFSTVDVDSPWSLNSTGSLTLRTINKVGKDINITTVTANGVSATPNMVVSAGATSGWITVTGQALSGSIGSSYQLSPVAIQYYLTSDASKTLFSSTGTLSGTRQ